MAGRFPQRANWNVSAGFVDRRPVEASFFERMAIAVPVITVVARVP
jgi:hypothetical protein